jgi:hypothetical protein
MIRAHLTSIYFSSQNCLFSVTHAIRKILNSLRSNNIRNSMRGGFSGSGVQFRFFVFVSSLRIGKTRHLLKKPPMLHLFLHFYYTLCTESFTKISQNLSTSRPVLLRKLSKIQYYCILNPHLRFH